MRVVVVSDTHGNIAAADKIVSDNISCDHFIFLGDGISEVEILRSKYPDKSFFFVAGNCDKCSAPTSMVIELFNTRILLTHGHLYDANNIKPGLTGWAQINGRDELELEDKAKLDGEYAKKRGLLMDTKCFLGSLHVFGKDDSLVEGGTGMTNTDKVGRNYSDGKTDEELIGNIGFGEPVFVNHNKKVRILITGSGSYIGEMFKRYAAEKYQNNFEISSIDMLDGTWREADFSQFDIVYHVAGIAHADVGNVSDAVKEKYYTVNTDLAVEVAQKAKKEGVDKFIFMSSMIIYGDSAPYGRNKLITDKTVPSPANFYGDSKLQADVGVRELATDSFKVIVLRPPMIYGRGSKGNYPSLAKLAKKMPVFPDVENQRSMLHIDNLCEFLCQIMLIDIMNQNAVVLVPQNGEYTKTSEMVKAISKVSGRKTVITPCLNPAVKIASAVPGKIGGLVNKAFGSNAYEMGMSDYAGINYRVHDLRESIIATEGPNTSEESSRNDG